jgi:hypothetical protein
LEKVTRTLGARRGAVFAAVLVVVVTGAGIWLLNAPRELVGTTQFVRQTDGKFGYEMLRPAAWTPRDGRIAGRLYFNAKTPSESDVLLSVNNLAVTARNLSDPDGSFPHWELFRRVRSLDGWTAGIEAGWLHDRVPFRLVETLPNAKVYATRLPLNSTTQTGEKADPHFGLVAYVVDQGQPLVIGLDGAANRPSLEPLDRLRAGGAVEGFITMVRSAKAIPVDPSNVSPPLD